MPKEDNYNQESAINDNPVSTESADTIDALKEEVARLKAENERLAAQLKSKTDSCNTYSSWWLESKERYDELLNLTRTVIKFAKLS